MQHKLLIYGDAVDMHSGLSRIARDLALISSTLPDFHTATFGRNAVGSSRFPFPQYAFSSSDQWGEHKLPQVWRDFTRGEGNGNGAILTVWDASRLLWFAGLSPTGNPELDSFLGLGGASPSFSRWGYFMIDGTGPDGLTLPTESRAVLSCYDRVLVSSAWGADVARKSGVECEWIPHPIDHQKFKFDPNRADRREEQGVFGKVVVGCCMTNQSRKDWPTAFAIAGLLAKSYGNRFLFWVHTDSLGMEQGAYWNLRALAADYGVPADCIRFTLTGSHTDSMMATFYNCCDATFLCSGGEGFGYPVAESLCCGCPVISQDWAASAELLDQWPDWKVPIGAFRLDTSHNILRAVHSPYLWVKAIEGAIEMGRVEGQEWRKEVSESMSHLWIQNLKKIWKRWLVEGVAR